MRFGDVLINSLKIRKTWCFAEYNKRALLRITQKCVKTDICRSFLHFSRKNGYKNIYLAIVSKRAETTYLVFLEHFPHSVGTRRIIKH